MKVVSRLFFFVKLKHSVTTMFLITKFYQPIDMDVAGFRRPNDVVAVAASREVGLDEGVASLAGGDARPKAAGKFLFAVASRNANVMDSAGRTTDVDGNLDRKKEVIKLCKSLKNVQMNHTEYYRLHVFHHYAISKS
jgi:hypothetical protein